MSDKFWDAIWPYFIMGAVALLGAASRRAYDVRSGSVPRFFNFTEISLDILIFAPGVVFGMAINEQFHLSGNTAAAVMVLTGYFGWRTLLVWLAKFKGVDVDFKGDTK